MLESEKGNQTIFKEDFAMLHPFRSANHPTRRIVGIIAGVVLLAAVAAAVIVGTGRKIPSTPLKPLGASSQEEAQPYTGTVRLLLVGTDTADDGKTACADSVLYTLWDCDAGRLELLQIPRDLLLEDGTVIRNATREGTQAGCEALCESVSELLQMPVDGYLALDLGGLGDIVEYIGGVEVDIPTELRMQDSYLPAGRFLLDRDSVDFLVRVRKVYPDGDFGRQAMLRRVFAGLLSYARSCTAADAVKLIPAIAPYLKTNLQAETLVRLAASLETVEAANVTFSSPSCYFSVVENQNVVKWDPEIIAPLLNLRFGQNLTPEQLNYPAVDKENDDYLEGSVQNLAELG